MSDQTLKTKIKLPGGEQSDLGLHCLPFNLHLLDTSHYCKVTVLEFQENIFDGCR